MGEKLLERIEDMLPNLIAAVIIILAGHIVSKITLRIMAKGLNVKHVDTTVHKFLMSTVRVVIALFVAIMALSVLKVPMTSIIAAVSTAGIAIGLALKDSLSNVAGGFIILFSKPFKCGDYIVINGTQGTVDAISMLYTKIRTVDNRIVYIPNSTVSSATIENYNGYDMRRLELDFSIGYGENHRAAMEIIRRVVRDDPDCYDKPDKPLIVMKEHGSSAIVIMLRVWIRSDMYWAMRWRLLQKVKEAFDENGIVIPYDQMDLHLDLDRGSGQEK